MQWFEFSMDMDAPTSLPLVDEEYKNLSLVYAIGM